MYVYPVIFTGQPPSGNAERRINIMYNVYPVIFTACRYSILLIEEQRAMHIHIYTYIYISAWLSLGMDVIDRPTTAIII